MNAFDEFVINLTMKRFPNPKSLWSTKKKDELRKISRFAYQLGMKDATQIMIDFAGWACSNKWIRWDDGTWRIRFDDPPTTFHELFKIFLNQPIQNDPANKQTIG